MKLIWATRGRDWGFRFLSAAGFDDPLPVYEEVFSGLEDQWEVCIRVDDKLALRFPDPLSRKDVAGRIIPHDFVLIGHLEAPVDSVEDGIKYVWPLVREQFDRNWDLPKPKETSG